MVKRCVFPDETQLANLCGNSVGNSELNVNQDVGLSSVCHGMVLIVHSFLQLRIYWYHLFTVRDVLVACIYINMFTNRNSSWKMSWFGMLQWAGRCYYYMPGSMVLPIGADCCISFHYLLYCMCCVKTTGNVLNVYLWWTVTRKYRGQDRKEKVLGSNK